MTQHEQGYDPSLGSLPTPSAPPSPARFGGSIPTGGVPPMDYSQAGAPGQTPGPPSLSTELEQSKKSPGFLKGVGRAMGLRVIGAAVIFGVIGIIGLFSSSKDVEDLSIGDCLADPGEAAEISTIDTIDCTEPHYAEVFYNGNVTGFVTYPGDDAVFDASVEQCFTRFADYVGIEYASSEFYLSAFTPTSSGWQQGDRGFTCVIVPDVGTLTGSAKGSGR